MVVLTKYGKVIVLVLGTFLVTLGLATSSQILLSYLLNIFGTIFAGFGYLDPLASIFSPVILILLTTLQPVFGWLSDRYGRKRFIVLAFLAYSLTAFLYPSIVVFSMTCFIFISSFLATMYTPSYDAFLADSVETRRRGLTFGAAAAVLSVASLVAPAFALALLHASGYLDTFYVSAGVVLSGAVLCLVFLSEPVEAKTSIAGHPKDYSSIREDPGALGLGQAPLKEATGNINLEFGLSRNNMMKVIISLIAINVLLSSVMEPLSFEFSYIAFDYGMGLAIFQAVGFWRPLLAIFSLVLGGVLCDLRGRKKTLKEILILGIVLSLVAYLALNGSYLWLLVALISIVTFVSSVVLTTSYALISDITPSSRRGVTYGFLLLGFSIGQWAMVMLSFMPFSVLTGFNAVPILFVLSFVFIIVAAILAILGTEEPEAAF
jgi:MFS family permease